MLLLLEQYRAQPIGNSDVECRQTPVTCATFLQTNMFCTHFHCGGVVTTCLSWREARNICCLSPVWNLRAVIWFIPLSHFPVSFFCLVLLLFLSCHFSSNGPFSRLFFQKFLQHFLLGDSLFCLALADQLEDRQLVGGMCSLLSYGVGVCHHAF